MLLILKVDSNSLVVDPLSINRTMNNFSLKLLNGSKIFCKKTYFSTQLENLTTVKFEDGVKTITMIDTKTRNSLSIPMLQKLISAIGADYNNPKLRVIVLSAEGPVFSAGHNLKELTKDSSKEQHKQVFKLCASLMKTMIKAPVPILAKVDGVAAAAGCQLVAQCDLAYCTEASQFSTPGINFGIFCSTPGVALARSIPKATALKMLLTGRPISSQEAQTCGLVTKTLPTLDALDTEISSICLTIKDKSRSVIELGKQFYYQQIRLDVIKAYELGGDVMVDNLQLRDGQEGIQSFVEKRKPDYNK